MRLVLILLAALVQAKFYKSSLEITKDKPWGYITKFGMDLGTGSFNLKAKLLKGNKVHGQGKKYPTRLQVYRDDLWTAQGSSPSCIQSSSSRFLSQAIDLPADGGWIDLAKGLVEQHGEPHFWIFLLIDCENSLGEYAKIKFEFEITNADGSHLSIEDRGLLSLYFWLSIAFLLALGANIVQTYRRFIYNDEFDNHLLWLNCAISIQFGSLLFEIFNLSALETNGKEVAVFDFLSRSSDEIAQLTLMLLLVAIAEGWTVTVSDFPSPEIYMAIFIFGSMFKFVLVAIGRLTDDSPTKFTEFENLSGLILLILRLVIYAWFLSNISYLFSKAPARVKPFLSKFTVTSSVYFLSQPFVVVLSLMFAPYLRTWIVVAGSVSIQTVSMFGLSLMFTRQKSEYNRVRETGTSLPGGIKDS